MRRREAVHPSVRLGLAILLWLLPILNAGAATTTIYPDTLAVREKRLVITPAMQPSRKTIGIALSGGGANGMAQIGVLKAFEEAGIEIDFITGTSIGAIIGGLYSAGYSPAELEKFALSTPWQSLLSLEGPDLRSSTFIERQKIRDRATIAIRFDDLKLIIPRSLSSAQMLTRTLDLLALNAPYHPRQSFDDLPIPFRAVTTDLVSGERVTLADGSLSEAMRASSTVPVIFEPVEIDEYRLADGGLVANLAVDELEKAGVDYRIAVDTRGSMYTVADDIDIPWKAADQAMSILIELQYPGQLSRADIVIAPDLSDHTALDFSNTEAVIQAGYESGKTLAATILTSTTPEKGPRTPFQGYTRSLVIEGVAKEHASCYHQAGELIRSSATIEDALQNLLKTDLFTRARAVRDTEKKNVIFLVTPLPRFDRVKIHGTDKTISEHEASACFAGLSGKAYTNAGGTRALENLLRLYRDKGLSLVGIDSVAVNGTTLDITLSEGNTGRIITTRNRGITKKIPIERELKIATGTPLLLEKAEKSIDNLVSTGAFNRVSLDVLATPKNSGIAPDLQLKLNEKPPSVLRLGLRYDQTYKTQALFDYRNENLRGTTNSLGGWAKISEFDNRVNMEYYIPRMGSTNLTFMSKLHYNHLQREMRTPFFSKNFLAPSDDSYSRYSIQRYGATSAFGASLSRQSRFLVDLMVENTRVTTKETEQLFEESNLTTGSIAAEFTLDSRNASQQATSGRYTHLFYKLTPGTINDTQYWQLSGSHEENFSINSATSGQLDLHVGTSSSMVPFADNFFIGGAGSPHGTPFIGLKENDLIGRNMVVFGSSLRYHPGIDIIFPSTFQLYYNMGQAWETNREFSFSSMIHGLGAGLSWKTPVGPANFTAGKAFTLNGAGKHEDGSLRFAESVFYFSLGHEF